MVWRDQRPNSWRRALGQIDASHGAVGPPDRAEVIGVARVIRITSYLPQLSSVLNPGVFGLFVVRNGSIGRYLGRGVVIFVVACDRVRGDLRLDRLRPRGSDAR